MQLKNTGKANDMKSFIPMEASDVRRLSDDNNDSGGVAVAACDLTAQPDITVDCLKNLRSGKWRSIPQNPQTFADIGLKL